MSSTNGNGRDPRAADVMALLREIAEGVRETNARLDQTNARLDQVGAEVSEVRAQVSEVRAQVSEVRADVSEVRARVEDVHTEVVEARAEAREYHLDLMGDTDQIRAKVGLPTRAEDEPEEPVMPLDDDPQGEIPAWVTKRRPKVPGI